MYECTLLRLSFSFTYVVLFDFPLFLSFFLSSVCFCIGFYHVFFCFSLFLALFLFFSFVICSVLYRSLNSFCCNYSAFFFSNVWPFSVSNGLYVFVSFFTVSFVCVCFVFKYLGIHQRVAVVLLTFLSARIQEFHHVFFSWICVFLLIWLFLFTSRYVYFCFNLSGCLFSLKLTC